MSKRYSKFKSAFIFRKEHSDVREGSIMERDWVTIGSKHKIEPGKKPVYGEGNFIFTDSSYVDYRYKKKYTKNEDIVEYTNSTNSLDGDNSIFDYIGNSNNLSDFVYYGSATELIKSTIEKIIREFPCALKASKHKLTNVFNGEFMLTNDNSDEYIIFNPFGLDLLTKFVGTDLEGKNMLRYLYISASSYLCNNEPITSYTIDNLYDRVKDDYNNLYSFLCLNTGKRISTITINNKYSIYVYSDNGDLIFSTKNKGLYIKPNNDIVEAYFNGLDFIERRLLNRNTNPIYTCRFEYKFEGQTINTNCTFPSDGFSLDIDTPSFENYINNLIEVANIYDLTKSNVINSKLVHESIKTLDWTSKHSNGKNTDEEYNVGLNRMEALFNVIGRGFDDIKNLIDQLNPGYKYDLKVFNPNTKGLTQDAKFKGWELFRLFSDNTEHSVIGNRWYKTLSNQKISATYVTNEFIKRLLHFTVPILTRKGTIEALNYIMSLFSFAENEDYTIHEVYYRFNNVKNKDKFIELYENIQDHLFDSVNEDPVHLLPFRVNDDVIEPFLGDKTVDDRNLYFHSLGSWVKFSDDVNEKYDYLETQSYLKSVNHIEDLTLINTYDARTDEPYYVVNVDKFHNYFPNHELTHYFHLRDLHNPQIVESWSPITTDHELWNKVEYLNTIINDTTDNNPHVGFGRYDMGLYYINSLINPFKYLLQEYDYISQDLKDSINNFKLEHTKLSTKGKVFVQKTIEPYSEEKPYSVGEVIKIKSNNKDKIYICIKDDNNVGKSFEDRSESFMSYIPETNLYKTQLYTLINTKVLVFENKINNKLYKEFLKNTILPYLYQVLPSTTTLIVVNS